MKVNVTNKAAQKITNKNSYLYKDYKMSDRCTVMALVSSAQCRGNIMSVVFGGIDIVPYC